MKSPLSLFFLGLPHSSPRFQTGKPFCLFGVVAIPKAVFKREKQNMFLKQLRCSFPKTMISVNFSLHVDYVYVCLLIRATLAKLPIFLYICLFTPASRNTDQSRLAESLFESKYEVVNMRLTELICFIVFSLLPQSYKRIWYNIFFPKGKKRKSEFKRRPNSF